MNQQDIQRIREQSHRVLQALNTEQDVEHGALIRLANGAVDLANELDDYQNFFDGVKRYGGYRHDPSMGHTFNLAAALGHIKQLRDTAKQDILVALRRVRGEVAAMNPMSAANAAVRIVNEEIARHR